MRRGAGPKQNLIFTTNVSVLRIQNGRRVFTVMQTSILLLSFNMIVNKSNILITCMVVLLKALEFAPLYHCLLLYSFLCILGITL